MTIKITRALDWTDPPVNVRDHYCRQIQDMPYSPDIRKMLKNIDSMVCNLSQAEVVARQRGQSVSRLDELKQVNDSIEHLEQWLIIGKLLG
jgi:hypothetical protein